MSSANKFAWLLVWLLAQTTIVWGAGKPNIVLLIADDLGYGELGCQGNLEIPTPHIDQLAVEGVRCTQAYVTAPNCSPSRAGLMSGRTPTRFGYEFNPIGAKNTLPDVGFPISEPMLAEYLQENGYVTGLIGKWHLGGTAAFHPMRRGFDEFFGFLHEGHFYAPPPWADTLTMLRRRVLPDNSSQRYWASDSLLYSSHMGHNEPPYDADNPVLRSSQSWIENEYLTDAFTREALSFMQQHRRQPFFLCLAYNAVHSPLQAKMETFTRFNAIEDIHRRIFAAMLSDLDASVGAICRQLDELKLRQDTLVIFLSDNGGPTKELTSSNHPLRGGKGSMYEGGLRVPFIIRFPGQLSAGEASDKVVSSLDILPTCLSACGATIPSRAEGRDLLTYLASNDQDLPPRELFWRQGRKSAFRQGSWKLIRSESDPRNEDRWELYNIGADISEQRDLASVESSRVQHMRARWTEINSEMSAPLFQ
ncbi:MAG: sulfatase-like hydrolase/transferase [Planctomycetales bacterium]|nr:sulfatase-like hydrolase/transferase [Planctomycetales bacterium]